MIDKTVSKIAIDAGTEIKQNLQYWLSRSPAERLSAVEHLRKQLYGDSERLQRTARVIKRQQS